ncbi:cytochrome P450 [Novosphingobium malaysiense]|uniref:Cytochrome P450 n=1 Tax=Novosphingobium malaysiense TaxID=1348853 RepID=A0A0B1ZGN6_9SPHN|nr:cytochrome P450 [Novosphingobium malaysiense]KHK90261.1 cytochrome P450 [Novosphingobium malaysiense]
MASSSTEVLVSPEERDLIENGSLMDPDIQAHPHAFYAALRKGAPVHFDERLGSWLITRNEDIWTVQSDPVTFSVEHGYHDFQARGMQDEFRDILRREGGGYFPDAIMSDPPYHTRIRRLMERAFTAHRVKELEPRIRDKVVELLDSVAGRGSCDAVRDIAIPLTIRVIVEQLGLDHGMEEKISRWSVAVTAQIGAMQSREAMIENARQICELQHYLIGKMKARESEPGEDMISDIVHAEVTHDDGTVERLTFGEAVSLVRAMLIAGNDTTASAISNLFYLLATRPEVAELLHRALDDERLLNRFVEELLRMEPPTRALARATTREVTVNGVTLPAGAHMLLVYGSGNDDETVFASPREFNVERTNFPRHVTFGGGPHKCIGLALARMEIKVMAREIARRFADVQLAVPSGDITYMPTVATRTIEALPITFSRREE